MGPGAYIKVVGEEAPHVLDLPAAWLAGVAENSDDIGKFLHKVARHS